MLTDPIWRTQEVNAEAAKFTFYEHEFEYEQEHGMNRVHLNLNGQDHLKQVAARICGGTPYPVVIERSRTSVYPYHKYHYPVHPNAELDERRRAVLIRGLKALGVPDAESRVVVSPPFPEGLPGPQAERAYYRTTMGAMGGGFGGFGGGFGGLGGGGFGGFGGGF
jgi:hypothetical protein